MYPGYRVVRITRARNLDQAVDVLLRRGDEIKHRQFDPRSGSDLGDSVPIGIWLVSKLIDLHDNLLAGPTGRKVNGVGALALLAVAMTGAVIWWPGIKTWRRSLTLHRGVGWKRFAWHSHSMIGFWSLGFMLVFGVSGAYLGFPQLFQDLADRLEPPTAANAGIRIGDRVIYWLAFLHFGRINGIGIPLAAPALRPDDEGDLGGIRTGPRGHVCNRRDHVVEPRAAPSAGKRSPSESFSCCQCLIRLREVSMPIMCEVLHNAGPFGTGP